MSLEDRSNDQHRDPGSRPKKAYEAPRLIEYGDISAVTQAVGMGGMADGGSMGTAKATEP